MRRYFPGLKYKINICNVCNKPIFIGRGRKYCNECRPKHCSATYYIPDPEIAKLEKKLGRPLTRVEFYLLKNDQIDLIFVG